MRIDWLSFTVHADEDHKIQLWKEIFEPVLGILVDTGHGLQGFKRLERALENASVMSQPVTGSGFYHVSLTGKSMVHVSPDVLKKLFYYLQDEKWNITRIDLAFDADNPQDTDILFTPRDFFNQVLSDDVKTFANRKTVEWYEAPFKPDEKGNVGTSGVYLGSRSSERMIRVYDMHGFTRLEFQLRHDRADIIGKAIMITPYSKWSEFGKSHLRQYVDFELWGEWFYFMGVNVPSDLKIGSAHRASLQRSMAYIRKQVSPTLSVLADVWGTEGFTNFINDVMVDARKKPRERYQSILENARQVEDVL
jgi:hypothetical protein